MNKIRIAALIVFILGIILINFTSADLMAFVGKLLSGFGLITAFTREIHFKKTKQAL